MPRFAANLTFLFTERPYAERFAAAAAAGFEAVEAMAPYELPAEENARLCAENGLRFVLFNTPAGDWAAGERGFGAVPGQEAAFDAGLDRALAYAAALDCPRIHVMAGIQPEGVSIDQCMETFRANLARAAPKAAARGVTLMLEPINPVDMPGYALRRFDDALGLLDALAAHPNIRLQFDVYHCQMIEGAVLDRLDQTLPRIGHVQIASVPGRHEPCPGVIPFATVFERLDGAGWDGWIGCEYKPRGRTEEGLAWMRDLG